MHVQNFAAIVALVTSSTVIIVGCAPRDTNISATPTPSQSVTVITHDSFAVPEDVLAAFEERSGLIVTFAQPGDAGVLVNQLILTKEAPIGDVVFGIDNTFASRAVAEDLFTAYESDAPAASDAAKYAVPGAQGLTAIDYSDVCINVDHTWFAERGIAEPTTLDDLTKPEYRGLLAVSNPATSSPGLAFLLATISAKGPEWPQYWEKLRANDVRIEASWSDVYYTAFSGPSSGGDYPLALSYASSPPFEVADGATEAPTGALLDTCFRQVEYAGILKGAKNPSGAQAVIDWMLSDEFQASIPESMYVYPVSTLVDIPPAWKSHAPLSPTPWSIDPVTIAAQRDQWIKDWTAVVID